MLADVDAHDARADAINHVADDARIIVQQSGVARGRGNARTLVETVGIEGPNGRGGWEGIDHCGDMVTGGRAYKLARAVSPPEAGERPADLATFKQMAQISAESLARRVARTKG